MRNLLFALLFVCPLLLFSQDNDYVMFLTIYLDPQPGMALELEAGVARHNADYHADDDNRAYLWSVLTGPRAGQYVWGMGPIKYAQMDEALSRPHAIDWEKNIAAYCTEVGGLDLWRRNEDLTYNPANQTVGDNIIARIMDVKHGGFGSVVEVVGNIKKVFEAKRYNQARRIYTREFRSDTREDIVLIYPFDSWADLENAKGIPAGFNDDYNEVHGADSWEKAVNMLQSNTDGWYDEVRVLVKN